MQSKDVILSVEVACKTCKKPMGLVIFESKKRGLLIQRDVKVKSAYCPECRKELSI